jgi:glycosyltransferase involved in cell wall biosynthesis
MSQTLSILHTEASLGWGGQEIRVLTEAAGMAARGHRVLLAAPPESTIYQRAQSYGVKALPLALGKKSLLGVRALRSLYAHERFDIVNTHSSTDTWLAAIANVMGQGPVLVRTRHISAPIPKNMASRWLYNKATRHIVTTGAALREQVIREVGADPARVTSVPTGIDLARYKPRDTAACRVAVGLATDAFIVGIVATLRSWKGHRYLLEAVAKLPDVHLAIVGDGPQREALTAQAAQLGVSHRVTFAGNQADVTQWLGALDVFCLPSYANEGVPQALMQAMASGLAVISTPVGAIGEIVRNEFTGLMVPPENADAIVAAIARLKMHADDRQLLARAAVAMAAERFGLDVMVSAMEGVFAGALKR